MPLRKVKPVHKRWPGKHAIKAIVYFPNGSFLQFETDLVEDDAKNIVNLLTKAMEKPEDA